MKSKQAELYNDIFRNQSGFSLVELMIAMAICLVAMLAVLGAMTAIKQATEKAYERSIVTQDIHKVIEEMRNAANAASSDSYQSSAMAAADAASTHLTSLPSSYQESIAVSYQDQTADPLDATITASWRQQGIRPTTLSMRALITRRI